MRWYKRDSEGKSNGAGATFKEPYNIIMESRHRKSITEGKDERDEGNSEIRTRLACDTLPCVLLTISLLGPSKTKQLFTIGEYCSNR